MHNPLSWAWETAIMCSISVSVLEPNRVHVYGLKMSPNPAMISSSTDGRYR